MVTKDTRSAMRAKKEELHEACDIVARKPFLLRRKFVDPRYAPLDQLWSSADAYLDLAASAVDAAEYLRDQTDREVDKLFWSQFNVPERPLPLTDQLAEWAELNRLPGLAMRSVVAPEPGFNDDESGVHVVFGIARWVLPPNNL